MRLAEDDGSYTTGKIYGAGGCQLAHRSALTVEQAYAASGDDPGIRQTAASAVPIISSHLQMVKQMRTKMGGS